MATLDQVKALIRQGHGEKAVAALQPAVRRRPKDPHLLLALAEAYTATHQFRFALSTYDRVSKLRPKAPKPLADKALLLQRMGQMPEANAALRKALTLAPMDGSLLRMLSATDRLPAEDPIIKRFKAAWDGGSLGEAEKIHAGFALFKALGFEGFSYLAGANAAQRGAHPWSIDARRKEVAALQGSFNDGPWPSAPQSVTAARPIFVVGLPRSGTTLVEQVLSCHPEVTAAGESGLPIRAAYSVLQSGPGFHSMAALSPDQLGLIRQRYLEGMAHFHSATGVFTDKSIQTHLIIGLLAHVLPQARIVVVRRDPRDVGWSIYRNYFETGTHGYSNDLRDIARYIRSADEMLEFWRDKAPQSFVELRYEDLVTDPEPVIRKLLHDVGLGWDPACLAPERSTRMVQTLSIDQVRSPISPASIGGWRRWATQLDPLVQGLGELGTAWD